jgi:hypothetical protein
MLALRQLSTPLSGRSITSTGSGSAASLRTMLRCSTRAGSPVVRMGAPNLRLIFSKFLRRFVEVENSPHTMDLQPHNLYIQRFGDIAIATFHLDDRPGVLNRRTIVLHRMGDRWKIVHLHASEVAVPAK